MTKSRFDLVEAVSADLVWSAAFAAYRINGGYLKTPERNAEGNVIRPINRELVQLALYDTGMITEADRTQARQARRYVSNTVTMEALKGTLTEWGQISAKLCALDQITSNYDIAVITAMPRSYANSLLKDQVDARLRKCEGHVGRVGEKIQLEAEVLRHNYSSKWNTWFISAVTADNRAIHFAYRESVQTGIQIQLRGTVKRHTDHSTQLNRVKLSTQEAV